jgi:hypothetical protein
MAFILSRQIIAEHYCTTPFLFRSFLFNHYCKQYTIQQAIFVLLTMMFFKKKGEGNYLISAIGTCHEIVLPLIKFSAMLYNENEKEFFVFHIRKDESNSDIKIFGLDANFNRRGGEIANGHTGVCIKKNGTYYVFDIILGVLSPVKLYDYLSIVVDDKNVWIHILDMKESNGEIKYAVEYDNRFYSVGKNSSNIKKILEQNLIEYKSHCSH